MQAGKPSDDSSQRRDALLLNLLKTPPQPRPKHEQAKVRQPDTSLLWGVPAEPQSGSDDGGGRYPSQKSARAAVGTRSKP
jgi:hypothetical protein